MAIVDRVRDLVAPIVAEAGVELYDIEHNGSILRILVDDHGGVAVGAIQQISRAVSRLLDEVDPVPGHYTLEVSSPGLERPLRTEAHYRSAIGADVKIKLGPQVEGDRRLAGTLRSVDPHGFELEIDGGSRRVAFADVTKARTVFEWGPTPKAGGRTTDPSVQTDAPREATTP
jgi:ribosome maturation factor RimP